MKKLLVAFMILGAVLGSVFAKQEGKIGLNVNAEFGFTSISWDDKFFSLTDPDLPVVSVIDQLAPSLNLGFEYDLEQLIKKEGLFLTANCRMVLTKSEYMATIEDVELTYDSDISIFIIDTGIMKKFYMDKITIDLGASMGWFIVNNKYIMPLFPEGNTFELSGSRMGATIRTGVEYALSPTVTVLGKIQYDIYSSPTEWDLLTNDEPYTGTENPSLLIDFEANGIGFTVGASFAF